MFYLPYIGYLGMIYEEGSKPFCGANDVLRLLLLRENTEQNDM